VRTTENYSVKPKLTVIVVAAVFALCFACSVSMLLLHIVSAVCAAGLVTCLIRIKFITVK